MTTEDETAPPMAPDRYTVATRGDAVRLPSWMTGEDAATPLTRGERARLAWARQSGKRHTAVVVLIALALVGGAATLGRVTVERIRAGTSRPAASPTPSPVPLSQVGEPRDLFAGTVAADYAVGEAGITLPRAAAQGPFTAREVTAALTQVRSALVAARLDTSMIVGDPEPFLALLAPAARRERIHDFDGDTFLHYATRIGSQDRAEEVRARGTMRYRATTNENGVPVLEITTEYVWLYAFDVPRTTPGAAGLAAIRDKVVWHVPRPDALPAAERGLWLVSAEASTSNVDCARLAEGFWTVEPWMGGPGSFKPC
ncbi:hypothetical protein AB0F68_16410 [Micromonospora sp. NPDC023966]|uniref:hypothetical protein n=1 Tax=Micromonospora sp. NPDC023966 TaxID=3154699 RepID=UPI0033E3C333